MKWTVRLVAGVCCSATALARPVAYTDSVGVYASRQAQNFDAGALYSLDVSHAVGLEYVKMNAPVDWDRGVFANFNGLIFRNNDEGTQSSLYYLLGAGYGSFQKLRGVGGILGLDAEFDSRYFIAEALYRSVAPVDFTNHSDVHTRLRIGATPFHPPEDAVQSWIFLELDHHSHFASRVTLTPILRLTLLSYLVEVGYGFDRSVFWSMLGYW